MTLLMSATEVLPTPADKIPAGDCLFVGGTNGAESVPTCREDVQELEEYSNPT